MWFLPVEASCWPQDYLDYINQVSTVSGIIPWAWILDCIQRRKGTCEMSLLIVGLSKLLEKYVCAGFDENNVRLKSQWYVF